MRTLHSLTLALLLLVAALPLAAADADHKDWINLLSVSTTITRPMGATQTPGAQIRIVEPANFLQQVEAETRPTGGRLLVEVVKLSPADRALGRSSYSRLALETPGGKAFSLERVRVRQTAQAQGKFLEFTFTDLVFNDFSPGR